MFFKATKVIKGMGANIKPPIFRWHYNILDIIFFSLNHLLKINILVLIYMPVFHKKQNDKK